jgi:hypothetical protein
MTKINRAMKRPEPLEVTGEYDLGAVIGVYSGLHDAFLVEDTYIPRWNTIFSHYHPAAPIFLIKEET